MRIIFLLLLLAVNCVAFDIDSISTSFPTWVFIDGSLDRKVEKNLRKDLKEFPTYKLLALAEYAARTESYDDARDYLLSLLDANPDLEPIVKRRLSDIYIEMGQKGPALEAMAAASESAIDKSYKKYLLKRVDTMLTLYREDLEASGWSVTHLLDTSKHPLVPVDTTKKYWENQLTMKGLDNSLLDSLLTQSKLLGGEKQALQLIKDTALVNDSLSTITIFSIAQKMHARGLPSYASDWLHKALNEPDFSVKIKRKEYLSFRAMLNYSLGNWGSTVKWSKQYFKEFGTTPELLYHVARSYRKMGKSGDANYYYLKHTEDFPQHKKSHDILWYLAWVYEEKGQFDLAIDMFNQIGVIHKHRKYGDDASFRSGLLYFRTGEWAKAITALKEFQKKFNDSELLPASNYWLARSYKEMKRPLEMDSALQELFVKTPLDYYAWQGRKLLQDSSDTAITLQVISDLTWQKKLSELTKSSVDTLFTRDELDKLELIMFLGTLGYDKEVELLMHAYEKRLRKDLPALYGMSHFLFKVGIYHRSYWLSKRLYYSIPVDDRWVFPLAYIKLLYPRVYEKELQGAAEKVHVEPDLVRAIMRQESMFSPQIVSYVGAVGLMQIMPYTGKEIAKDLDTTFNGTTLYNPDVNLRFGSYYIGKLLKQFDGKQVQAIASYNGGPHNVKKWVKRNEEVLEDTPYFVECIGFTETRNYVKRVLENYWTYGYLQKALSAGITVEAIAEELSGKE